MNRPNPQGRHVNVEYEHTLDELDRAVDAVRVDLSRLPELDTLLAEIRWLKQVLA
jgi:hypothetical protein